MIRLWEAEPSLFLSTPFLLPLATLAKTTRPESLLKAVAERVDIIEDRAEQSNVSACAQLLAGINFDESLISIYLKEELMRESVVYQRIVAESRRAALQEGAQQGEATLVLRQLSRRFGALSNSIIEKIGRLGTEELETLGEALLDFESLADLDAWLAGNRER